MAEAVMNIKVEGLDKLLRTLGKLGPAIYRPAIAEAGAHIKSVIAVYPPRRFGPQPFKTDKQRRYFFYALHAGLIDVPYRRGLSPGSEALGRRWTVEIRDNGLTAVVGNNARYAGLVQRFGEQADYHKLTGWKTDRQVALSEAGKVKDILSRYVREALKA